MSESDPALVPIERRGAGRDTLTFGTLVVCGGGCYGSYYVRQLDRAARAGAVRWERLLVVDRDANCRVAAGGASAETADRWMLDDRPPSAAGAPPQRQHATAAREIRHHSPAPRVVVSPWTEFFDAYLGRAAAAPDSVAADAIVPSPLMPHLMFEWLLRRAAARWPDRAVAARPLAANPGMPWHRHAETGTYVSFAEWMCPINCIEPARCPETRGSRSWSIAPTLRAWVDAAAGSPEPVAGPALLHCTHRAFGVGMFDTSAVLDADATVAAAGGLGEARVVIGTVSHCHGALGLLHVGA